MKKLFIIFTVLANMMCTAYAQKQTPNHRQENNPLEKMEQIYSKDKHSNFPKVDIPQKNKKANEPFQKARVWDWDTIVTYDTLDNQYYRLIRTYDASGNELTYLKEYWVNNAWENKERKTSTYDVVGILLTELNEYWVNNAWVNSSRYSYTYYSSGKVSSAFLEFWNNNAWRAELIDSFTYNASGNLLIFLRDGRFLDSGWVHRFRYTYTYDVSGNLLTYVEENRNNDNYAFMYDYRHTYTYDASGNRLSCISESWENNTWVNYFRNTNTYDADGNMLTVLYDIVQNNAWVHTDRFSYTYDAAGNVLTILGEYCINFAWVYSSRKNYNYDGSGNLLTYEEGNWEKIAWVYKNRKCYTYDNYGNSISGFFKKWENKSWVPIINNSEFYMYRDKTEIQIMIPYVYRFKASFVSFGNDNVNTHDNHFIKLYPNPATDMIIIECNYVNNEIEVIDIYNNLGQKVFSTGLTSEINISEYPNGIYFMKLTLQNGETITRKIVKN